MANILIADDEPDVLLILSERLRGSGHAVECVADGAEAIQRSNQAVFHLLILDIRMPGFTGYEVCEHVKSSVKNGKTPVLLTSAFPEEETKWRESKADAFLAKPFETGKLSSEVENLLKKIA